jgi:hypothetical protein
MQTTNGMLNPPKKITFIFGIFQSASGAILLAASGLEALQYYSRNCRCTVCCHNNLNGFLIDKIITTGKEVYKIIIRVPIWYSFLFMIYFSNI